MIRIGALALAFWLSASPTAASAQESAAVAAAPATEARPSATRATDPATAADGPDAVLTQSVRRIAGRVAALRGQAFSASPEAIRAPQPMLAVAAEIRAYAALSPDRLRARGRAWADLGLGIEATPSELAELLATDLAGIAYDPTRDRLLIAPGTMDLELSGDERERRRADAVLMSTGVRLDEPLVAHGLTHLLQYERDGAQAPRTTDGLLARAAWSEGEATLVAIRTLFDGMGLGETVLRHDLDPRDVLDGALFPEGLDSRTGAAGDLVRFVYLDGFAGAAARYLGLGWEGLDRAIAAGKTTRGVIHPGRDAVPAPPEAPPPPPEGLREVDRDTLGEEAIAVLLARTTDKDNLALMGADGWDGDLLVRYEPPEGPAADGVTVWRSRWSDAAEAEEFVYALVRGLERIGQVARGADGTQTGLRAGRRTTVTRDGAVVDVVVDAAPAAAAAAPNRSTTPSDRP